MSGGWFLTDHVCGKCLGRVLERDGMYQCADCGEEAKGQPEKVCACGVRTEVGKAPFRCTRNPSPSPANPARVIVALVDVSTLAL